MKTIRLYKTLHAAAAFAAFATGATGAMTQAIKVGSNGDLSASPSAQSGQSSGL